MSDDGREKPSSLRLWLARYKPEMVRCTLRDGTIRELPTPGTGRGKWAQLEHAIMLLGPAYIEAMVGKNCAASRSFEAPEEEPEEEVLPPGVVLDPMTAMIKGLPTIVQLIVDAADASAARHEQAYALAFEKQLELVSLISGRLTALEAAWHQIIMEKMAHAGDDNDDMVKNIVGNMFAGGGPKSTTDKPNGVPKKDEPK